MLLHSRLILLIRTYVLKDNDMTNSRNLLTTASTNPADSLIPSQEEIIALALVEISETLSQLLDLAVELDDTLLRPIEG